MSSDFYASAFCRTLAGEGIYMTVREFPADEDAYYAKFHEVKGMVYNRASLTDRQRDGCRPTITASGGYIQGRRNNVVQRRTSSLPLQLRLSSRADATLARDK